MLKNLTVERKLYNGVGKFKPEKVGNFTPEMTIRYEIKELKTTSTKFVKNSLMNLTVTVNFGINRSKKYIYANFDPINKLILMQNQGII